jgi:AcrR family transcriptional regulator
MKRPRVRAKAPARAYHHGELRAGILGAGLEMLQKSDAAALSMREIARMNGVTAPALYRHFPDKEALLSALAEEGLRTLAAEQRAAMQVGGKEGFAAIGRAYVRFAVKNPALFRLIFSAGPQADDRNESAPAKLLAAQIDALAGPAADARARRTSALRAWSLVHGLAMLLIDGQIDASKADSYIRDVISADSIRVG